MPPIPLRCPGGKKHGHLEATTVEVKCDSRFCGAGRGVVVLHTFDLVSGELVKTEKFNDPATGNKERRG